jgi:hypothetical protein
MVTQACNKNASNMPSYTMLQADWRLLLLHVSYAASGILPIAGAYAAMSCDYRAGPFQGAGLGEASYFFWGKSDQWPLSHRNRWRIDDAVYS